MIELKLVATLIGSLLLQLLFLPFKGIVLILDTIEKGIKIIKETIKHFIKITQDEIIK